MRRLFGLALATLFLIIFWTASCSSTSNQLIAEQSASKIERLHQKDQPLPSPILAQSPAVPVAGQSVSYGNLNNQPIVGYLARPTEANNPLPALIVIHEWWGLNDNIKTMTQKLAGEGYTALAVDLYNGQVADNPNQAKELVTAALKNPQLLENNLRQAYQYLETKQEASKIGSIGWCFGGTWSLNTALLFPNQLDAAVIYYGGGIETNPERLKTLQMPILGIFGALDQSIPVETVRQFETTLKSLDKSVEIYIYDDADHAFANPSVTHYNAQAAEDAWKHTTAFLAKSLKTRPD